MTNLVYHLQASADLAHWTNLQRVAGDGATHSVTNAAAGPQFFRLSIAEAP